MGDPGNQSADNGEPPGCLSVLPTFTGANSIPQNTIRYSRKNAGFTFILSILKHIESLPDLAIVLAIRLELVKRNSIHTTS